MRARSHNAATAIASSVRATVSRVIREGDSDCRFPRRGSNRPDQQRSSISRSTAAAKFAGQLAEDSTCDIEVVLARRSEHSLHSSFDGSGRFAVQRLSMPCQSQEPPTPIALVGPSADQIATLKSLQQGGERTGVQVQNVGQLPRMDTRKPADDPNHQALRARDAKRRRHGLGPALKRVVDGPNQTQEVDCVTDRQPGWRETGPARHVSHGGLHARRRVFQGVCRFPPGCGCSRAPPRFAFVPPGWTAADPVDQSETRPRRFRHLPRR